MNCRRHPPPSFTRLPHPDASVGASWSCRWPPVPFPPVRFSALISALFHDNAGCLRELGTSPAKNTHTHETLAPRGLYFQTLYCDGWKNLINKSCWMQKDTVDAIMAQKRLYKVKSVNSLNTFNRFEWMRKKRLWPPLCWPSVLLAVHSTLYIICFERDFEVLSSTLRCIGKVSWFLKKRDKSLFKHVLFCTSLAVVHFYRMPSMNV